MLPKVQIQLSHGHTEVLLGTKIGLLQPYWETWLNQFAISAKAVLLPSISVWQSACGI